MSNTQVTESEPVLMFNDKKYIISDLHDDAKMLVALLQGLEGDVTNARLTLDRLLLAKEGYTSKLLTKTRMRQNQSPKQKVHKTKNPLSAGFLLYVKQ